MSYEVTLKANVVEVIAGADAYMQEGPLTTFFEGRDGRTVLDAWTRPAGQFPHRRHCVCALGGAGRGCCRPSAAFGSPALGRLNRYA